MMARPIKNLVFFWVVLIPFGFNLATFEELKFPTGIGVSNPKSKIQNGITGAFMETHII